jgi:predicted MFS family arabinose efflux permease
MQSPHVNRLIAARALRAFGDGFVSLLLPLYLIDLGYDTVTVGLIASATLVGSGAMTLAVGLTAHRYHYRTLLIAAACLMAATGVSFAAFTDLWPLLVIAVVGTLNPSSGDVSVFLPMEHAVLARVVDDRHRTAVFARYALAGTLVAALGSLAAGVPSLLGGWTGWPQRTSLAAMFILYALLGVAIALVYRGLPRALASTASAAAPLGPSRRAVFTLAALFSLDAFGGGFVVQSLVALWLYQRHGLSPAEAGTLFFATGVMSAFSYLAAVRIAKRIGLVNTMVFTHIPSSLLLVTVAYAPTFPIAAALFLLREGLVEMDVPTRQSYVLAVVRPEEATVASGVTSLVRMSAWAVGPAVAGVFMQSASIMTPLVVGAAMKIGYDLLLWKAFRSVKPPEEW